MHAFCRWFNTPIIHWQGEPGSLGKWIRGPHVFVGLVPFRSNTTCPSGKTTRSPGTPQSAEDLECLGIRGKWWVGEDVIMKFTLPMTGWTYWSIESVISVCCSFFPYIHMLFVHFRIRKIIYLYQFTHLQYQIHRQIVHSWLLCWFTGWPRNWIGRLVNDSLMFQQVEGIQSPR